MKLLLTSGGLTNQAIAEALFDLVGKRPEETSLVFIPTASSIETEDKKWLIDDLMNIKKQNFKKITITDISAVPEKIWRPQLEEADVIFFGGGNSYYLMDWINKSGLVAILPELLKTRVYVGLSAGSMVTAPNLNVRLSKTLYGAEAEKETMAGLGYVNFLFLPHLNSPDFPIRVESTMKSALKEAKQKTYVLDDESALKITDGKMEVVGGGKWLEVN
ncbi:MAG: Type 1 glutamine amidotransferase-like domain-containing protein [Candidatus Paceibacterota bacterium]